MKINGKSLCLAAAAAFAAGLAAGGACGWYLGGRRCGAVPPAPSPSLTRAAGDPEGAGLPDAAALRRAADRALRDTGSNVEAVGVELGRPLSDGACPVAVRLINGRVARGMLYRDRLRWKIAVDPDTLRSADRVVIVEHERIR